MHKMQVLLALLKKIHVFWYKRPWTLVCTNTDNFDELPEWMFAGRHRDESTINLHETLANIHNSTRCHIPSTENLHNPVPLR